MTRGVDRFAVEWTRNLERAVDAAIAAVERLEPVQPIIAAELLRISGTLRYALDFKPQVPRPADLPLQQRARRSGAAAVQPHPSAPRK